MGKNEAIGKVTQAYSYEDNVPAARSIAGIDPQKLPQFVAVTFDDNFYLDGVEWANGAYSSLQNPSGKGTAKTFDGTPVRTTFYSNGTYADWDNIPAAWAVSEAAGHEIANHTQDHFHGGPATVDQWRTEITDCENAFVSHSVVGSTEEVIGLRSPYLEYADAGLSALELEGYTYDTSIQGCWDNTETGANCFFPYTLNSGSPDAVKMKEKFGEPTITTHPGLWEVPVHALIVPPDSEAANYGFTAGLRARVPTAMPLPSYYEPTTGKIAPLDFTLMVDAQLEPNEVLAILKYSFDLHLNGNRAPLVFVAHTHLYSTSTTAAAGTTDGRRKAIEDFLAYALSKQDTRMRPVRDILEYMRAPVDLDGNAPSPVVNPTGGTGGVSASGGNGSNPSNASGGMGGATTEPEPTNDVPKGCSCRTTGQAGDDSSPYAFALAALVAAGAFVRRRSSARTPA